VIRFADPRGIDFPYLLSMIRDAWMSRANTLVVPGGMMELAMQLLFTPFVWRMMDQRRSGGGRSSRASARALRAANGLHR
jgi:phosphoribulokinase